MFINGDLSATNSTLSGNYTAGADADGGAINARNAVTFTQSTVTDNQVQDVGAQGGGIWAGNDPVELSGTILAGNTAGGGGPDLRPPIDDVTVNYSLIGTGIAPTAGGNNVVTDTPLIGPLADNSGLTETHAILPGSLAIDAGDPSVVYDPGEFDQRGTPYARVWGAAVDIGAYETLELIVDTAVDESDGDFGPGDLSLREAVELANLNLGSDVITFDAGLSGQSVLLGGTEIEITDALIIDAKALATDVTVDAQQNSRVFNISAPIGNFTFAGLTLTGGRTTDAGGLGGGGAIRSGSSGLLTLDGVTVSASSTIGMAAPGGGIFSSGSVVVIDSNVSGNTATSESGGGIFALGDVTLDDSAVSGNTSYGAGGGIFSVGNVLLTASTVSGNSTSGANARGGGVYSQTENVTLVRSTVSGNSTSGDLSQGGGIAAPNGDVTLTDSTLSGNSTTGESANGGGAVALSVVTLTRSTVTDNHASGASALGGGVSTGFLTLIEGSILAGNTAAGGNPDLRPVAAPTANHSLLGTGIVPGAGASNVFDDTPLLGALADNGGPTETHLPLAGSPAINAGDPAAVAGMDGVPLYDQRGVGFDRVVDGRIDIGATESAIASLAGDGNLDGAVDGLDYLLWAGNFGDDPAKDPPGAPQNGDYNNDDTVDGLDYLIWAGNYGSGTATATSQSATAEELKAVDAALESDFDIGTAVADDVTIADWQVSHAFNSVLKKRDKKGK